MLQNPRQKSFKFADLEQAVSDCIHKTCSISSVDDHTLRFAWKAKGLLSSLVGRTRTCDLHAIGIQGNRLFLSTDPDSKENADLLLDDLARTLNNGDATSAWEWSGTTPDDTTESPMIHQSLKMIVFYQEKLLFGQPLTWSHTGDGFEIAEEGGLRTEPRLYGNTGNFGIGLTQ